MDVRVVHSLPRLAWLLRVVDGEATAWVGPWVEVGDGWFVEGAWNGPFTDAGFDTATSLMGSGVRWGDRGLRIAAPTTNVEHLYSIEDDGVLAVSNSLVFSMEFSGIEPDTSHRDYFFDLVDAQRLGIRRRPFEITGGIRVHTHVNLVVGPDGRLTEERKPAASPPQSFDELHALLQETMEAVFANAADAERVHAFRPVATLSAGYDSTAVAALAASLGCREAVTSVDPRAPHDAGRPIGELLGMDVTEYPRAVPADLPIDVVAEFLTCGAGVEMTRAIMEPQLEGSLLLLGNLGDSLFSYERGLLPDYGQPTASTSSVSSMAEFRKRIGMITFVVPSIAALFPDETYAISRSEEMRPWSVDGRYNRPIARRIGEEAGIPREMFGQMKAATSHTWPHRDGLPPEAQEAFDRFLVGIDPDPGREGMWGAIVAGVQRNWRAWVKWRLPRYSPAMRQRLKWLALRSWWRRNHDLYAHEHLYLYHWAVGVTRARYRLPAGLGQ